VEDVVGSTIGLQFSHGSLVMFLTIVCCNHETSDRPSLLISNLKNFLEVSRKILNQNPPLPMKQQCASLLST